MIDDCLWMSTRMSTSTQGVFLGKGHSSAITDRSFDPAEHSFGRGGFLCRVRL